jgi:outer membrane lipoprotein-sorting protein
MRRREIQNGQRLRDRLKTPALLLLLPMLNGCLVHTRTVKQAMMPSVVMTATADQLVTAINDQCQEIHTLSATVEFQATEGGPRKGKEKTFTSFSGYIRLRKPDSLRVIGLLPVIRTRAFDMATDGNTFKLLLPHYNKVVEGPNTVTKESSNALENFRPNVFSESLLISCIGSNDLVTLTSDTETVLDPKSKQMTVKPEYDLTVVRRKENSQELIPERVIHFSRIDLHPFQVDIYDPKGAIQTIATYGPLQKFGTQQFPGTITIKRPLEELQIVITFTKVSVNLPLDDQTFELAVPAGTTVQQLQ